MLCTLKNLITSESPYIALRNEVRTFGCRGRVTVSVSKTIVYVLM